MARTRNYIYSDSKYYYKDKYILLKKTLEKIIHKKIC